MPLYRPVNMGASEAFAVFGGKIPRTPYSHLTKLGVTRCKHAYYHTQHCYLRTYHVRGAGGPLGRIRRGSL